MSETRFFIFGAGYSARAFARANPAIAPIAGTTRSSQNFDALRRAGIAPMLFDGAAVDDDIRDALGMTTHLIVSIAPGDEGDVALAALRSLPADSMPLLRWVGYLSTVGVYGDHQGAWVDETSECRPVSKRSVLRLDAEKAWQDWGKERGTPVAVLRLSGIYGPGRNTFVNLANGTAKRLVKKDQVFNRIHVDDIAAALWTLSRLEAGGIFNVTDDEPAPPQDVVTHAAGLMGIAPPPEQPFDTAEISPMARSFYGENKRVSNARLKSAGFSFLYPDYRTAQLTMWTADSWRGDGKSDGRSSIREG